LHNVCSADNFV